MEKSQSELQSRISSLETKDTAAAADTAEEMTPAGDSEAPAAAEPAAVEPAVTETSAAPEISEAPVAAESEDKSGN